MMASLRPSGDPQLEDPIGVVLLTSSDSMILMTFCGGELGCHRFLLITRSSAGVLFRLRLVMVIVGVAASVVR